MECHSAPIKGGYKMKKMVLLLSVALLAACGGTSSNTVTPVAGNSAVSAAEKATFTLTVTGGALSKRWDAITSPSVTYRRISITNTNLNTPGYFYQVAIDKPLADYSFPADYTFPLPKKAGYKVEVMDYTKTSSVYTTYSSATLADGTTLTGPTTTLSAITTPIIPYKVLQYGTIPLDLSAGDLASPLVVSAVTVPALALKTHLNAAATSIPSRSIKYGIYSTFKAVPDFTGASACRTDIWDLKLSLANTFTGTGTQVFYAIMTPVKNSLRGPIVYIDNISDYYYASNFYVNDTLLLRTYNSNSVLTALEGKATFVVSPAVIPSLKVRLDTQTGTITGL